jgi:hypothetical protein
VNDGGLRKDQRLSLEPQNYTTFESSTSASSIEEAFEIWWMHYPRKVDKGAARKAFRRVLAGKVATFEQLMRGVMRYAAEKTGADPQFTKHPATWLNAEAWDNEPLVRLPAKLSFADSAILGMMSRLDEEDFSL